MRKLSLSLLLMLAASGAFAQSGDDQIKKATLVIQFGAFDFATPQLIRRTSLGSVMSNNQWTKLNDQNVALGISYIKGISNHFDFSINYFLTSVNYPFRDGTPKGSSDHLLQEVDASIMMKLLTDKAFMVPYLTAGVGASVFKGGRYDAFIPVGAGLQFKLLQGTFLFSNFQYRLPVTERANYHFVASIGFAGTIGK